MHGPPKIRTHTDLMNERTELDLVHVIPTESVDGRVSALDLVQPRHDHSRDGMQDPGKSEGPHECI